MVIIYKYKRKTFEVIDKKVMTKKEYEKIKDDLDYRYMVIFKEDREEDVPREEIFEV
jgi:hypothetical protein